MAEALGDRRALSKRRPPSPSSAMSPNATPTRSVSMRMQRIVEPAHATSEKLSQGPKPGGRRSPVLRSAPARLLRVVLAAAGPWSVAAAQEPVVDGFRGHPWGSRVEDVPEIADTEQVGERDGLRIYSTEVRLLGRQALAGYYFHPDTGELVEGAYVMVMPLESCQTIWELLARDVQRTYPGLDRQGELPSRRNAHRPVYESDCEYFVYNHHREEWRMGFGNPDPPHDEVRMWIRVNERTPRLHVVYRSERAGPR